jgi:uncharacterized protein
MEMQLPLSDEELEELEHFLSSDAAAHAMDIAMLDGFLTALAISPANLPPSQWLPEVWGEGVAWHSPDQQERMTALVFRHANDLLFYLRDRPTTFEPLLYEREHAGKTEPVIDEWCIGFVIAMGLDEAAWEPLLDSDEGDELLEPILLFGSEAGWEQLKQDPALAARQAEFAAMLGDIVLAILDWSLPLRKAAGTRRRDAPKTGRNDSCPCGSGRKFKKCCGAPRKLH